METLQLNRKLSHFNTFFLPTRINTINKKLDGKLFSPLHSNIEVGRLKKVFDENICFSYPSTHDIDYVFTFIQSQALIKSLAKHELWERRNNMIFVLDKHYSESKKVKGGNEHIFWYAEIAVYWKNDLHLLSEKIKNKVLQLQNENSNDTIPSAVENILNLLKNEDLNSAVDTFKWESDKFHNDDELYLFLKEHLIK